jgi:hypothetical protein|tara:strand:+ start:899 stop:1090 length:192 start_codon:yes stop_codon:yes gene_type:complete
MNNFYIGYMLADNELKEVLEKHQRAWVKRALKSFDNDPPATSFQKGYRQLLIEELETSHLLNR